MIVPFAHFYRFFFFFYPYLKTVILIFGDALKTLYFLVGPTAVGKTDCALSWAHELNAEILCCDSLLVYRGMNIGTAKPTPSQQKTVQHHGLDLVPPSQPYCIADYVRMAKAAVIAIAQRERKVLVTGGSGFYLKSFFYPVIDQIAVSPIIRKRVRQLEAEKGLEGMVKALQSLNPEGLDDLDTKNPRRVANALMRCLASGKTISELLASYKNQAQPFESWNKRVICLQRDTDDLHQRIEARAESMIALGLVEEVKQLLEQGLEQNPQAASAIGYRETIQYLAEGKSVDWLKENISGNTRRLAKKQMNWFRKHIPIDQLQHMNNPDSKSFNEWDLEAAQTSGQKSG